MMNLSSFSLLKEDDSSYTVGNPKGKSIQVPKKGLSDKAQSLIGRLKREQGFSDGSDQVGNIEPNSSQIPAQDDFSQGLPASVAGPENPGAPAPVQNDIPYQMSAQQAPASFVADISKPLTQEKQAVQAGTEAENTAGQETAKAQEDYAKAISTGRTLPAIFADYQSKDNALQQAFMDKKIDPDRFFHNMGTGSRVSAAIGMILGGVGSGLTGQPNLAYQALNNAIERDIDAQKNDQSKAMNLWKMNKEALHDETQTRLAVENQYFNIAKAKIMSAAARAQGPLAAAKAAPIIADIDQRIIQNNQTRSILSHSAQGGLNDTDPAQLVTTLVTDPTKQQKVFDEIEAAQNTKRSSSEILNAFDKAGSTINATDFVPGMENRYQKALHALMGPTFKDVEGTVRQAAMDNMAHNTTPQFGDNKETLKTKREALQGYLASKSSAATAKGFGIDLNNFNSTAPMSMDAGRVERMNGKEYKKVPGGWQEVK